VAPESVIAVGKRERVNRRQYRTSHHCSIRGLQNVPVKVGFKLEVVWTDMQNTESNGGVAMLGLAFLSLGVFIGTLLAMSAQSLAQAVVAALFASFGGSILLLVEKLAKDKLAKACLGILAISLGGLIGTYSGIYVTEYQVLTPVSLRVNSSKAATTGTESRKYLRENVVSGASAIDMKYRTGALPANEAYEKLKSLLVED